MVDIQTERIMMAHTDVLFDDADDDCPKKKMAYKMMESIRQANNQEILEQIRGIARTPCNPSCRHRHRAR
ncbi:hypothetical protein [Methanomassiliicoccus luminyensis]|uniref:hypothetical protein n=1 Tax=Methanomassiliicoccus luminyensis TaxID=1080712 RepID=UPI000474EF69|nr:hypothetical protein [Methanomassiliicoccus luminyensis]